MPFGLYASLRASYCGLPQRWNENRSKCRQFGIRQRMRDLQVGAIGQDLLIFIVSYLVSLIRNQAYSEFPSLIE